MTLSISQLENRRSYMDDEDFWYWMTLTKPAYYWMAKSIGGKAEKGADRAMEELSQALPAAFVVIAIIVIVFLFLTFSPI